MKDIVSKDMTLTDPDGTVQLITYYYQSRIMSQFLIMSKEVPQKSLTQKDHTTDEYKYNSDDYVPHTYTRNNTNIIVKTID